MLVPAITLQLANDESNKHSWPTPVQSIEKPEPMLSRSWTKLPYFLSDYNLGSTDDSLVNMTNFDQSMHPNLSQSEASIHYHPHYSNQNIDLTNNETMKFYPRRSQTSLIYHRNLNKKNQLVSKLRKSKRIFQFFEMHNNSSKISQENVENKSETINDNPSPFNPINSNLNQNKQKDDLNLLIHHQSSSLTADENLINKDIPNFVIQPHQFFVGSDQIQEFSKPNMLNNQVSLSVSTSIHSLNPQNQSFFTNTNR